MPRFRAALIQLNSNSDPDHNLNRCEALVREASEGGAKLIGLPENFSYFGSEKEKLERAHEIEEKTREFLHRVSQKHNVYILAGGYPNPSINGKVYNTASLYSPEGVEKIRYHKIHLFDTDPGDGVEYRESKTVEAGDSPAEVYHSLELGNISSVICYDLRFPELFRKLADQNAEIIFVPSAFTKITGQAHWEILLRARAIENQCFILAPAQTGTHSKGRETYGHSLIVNPWGEILADGKEGEKVVFAEIDLEEVEKVRKKIPALKHRRVPII
ncbi:carbon-nitrogen hydrolase family protein [Leptospira semungkisensis]|uniref:Carbon-nitrogen hydrolase family protein n=1 Tax=Leptospira semungkisensis TaxID=2484985 RepID=A0A4R9G7G2_9LEPT|nr:carbon-nitrogen hydrolase family protein [Leptospira semungkisensis]TGK06737.1 carbon-nitrogen hydrolase family protein [Leptospira semungkisensis]